MYEREELPARGLSADLVRAQLARVLRSRTFSTAPALSRLLRHLVECALNGDTADRLKEYSIGVEVFDRGEAFDPRTDTIVRVQARRLRSRLEAYYRTTGQFDPVLIEIPTGHYIAVFSPHAPAVPSSEGTPSAAAQRPRLLERVPHPADAVRPALPASRTPLVGRRRELEAIAALLCDDCVRLVTLTGPGGSGKTRLALEAAQQIAAAFKGGVLIVSLAPLTDAAAVPTALAQVLGLRYTAGQPLRQALRVHAQHAITAPTLLLLDNFEQVIDASPVIGDLLGASAHLKILVTSRTVLHLYGEHEQPVPPLEVPDVQQGLRELERNPAVELFVQRARSIDNGFALTADNAATVAAICRRLDGLPLALELAAARIKLFPPDGMRARLEHSLAFLTTGPSDVPARQRTLRNTIDWSHALLTGSEQRLFRRVAVLAGGFTLEAAEAVCNAHRDLGIDVVSGVGSLMDKSLVHRVAPIGAEARFNMLQTVREYALECLASSGDAPRVRRAQAAYAIVLAEEGAARQSVAEREAWLRRCDVELDNFRVTLEWLIASRNAAWALRLALALFAFWERRELVVECRHQLRTILDLRTDPTPAPDWALAIAYLGAVSDVQGESATARVLAQQALEEFIACGHTRGEAAQLNALAANSRFQGDTAAARTYWERALAVCREIGNPPELAAALSNLALCLSASGDAPAARTMLQEARDLFTAMGDEAGVLWSVNHLGDVERRARDATEARRLYRAALDGFTRIGDAWGMARSSADLADVSSELEDHAAARALLEQALTLFVTIDHKRGIARVLESFALLADRQQQFDRALTLAGAAAAVRLRFGGAPRASERERLDESLATAWGSLPDGGAHARWDRGRHMSLDEAIRFALG